ncbi:MAG: hypothetical protein M3158_09485 [Pseudomonadota bacterium]|jgi:hypothetical protein|nr:hypothetical protein [Pseudomonadota bacterium]
MPVLDAKALKADPDGLAFLRDVLRPAGTGAEKPVAPLKTMSRPRRNAVKASAPVLPAQPPRVP